MRKFIFLFFFIACICLPFLSLATLEARVSKILGANIDATPPTTPPAPSSVTYTTPAVSEFGTGSLAGFRTSDNRFYTSPTGTAWTIMPTNPTPASTITGVQIIGSRVVASHTGTGTCILHYTDDGGTNWTTQSLTGTTTCPTLNTSALRCISITCVLATGAAGGMRLYTSTNSGTSWSQTGSFAITTDLNTIAAIKYFDGTTAIGTGQGQAIFPAIPNQGVVSTNAGASWALFKIPSCAVGNTNLNIATVTKLGSTFYAYGHCVNQTPTTYRVWTSATGTGTWSLGTVSFSPAILSQGVGEVAVALNLVNPPTIYFMGRRLSDFRNEIWTSTDGLNFTALSLNPSLSTVLAAVAGFPSLDGSKAYFTNSNNEIAIIQ